MHFSHGHFDMVYFNPSLACSSNIDQNVPLSDRLGA